jgi:hypothetical protein
MLNDYQPLSELDKHDEPSGHWECISDVSESVELVLGNVLSVGDVLLMFAPSMVIHHLLLFQSGYASKRDP